MWTCHTTLEATFGVLGFFKVDLRAGAIRKQDGDWPPRCRFAACVPEPIRSLVESNLNLNLSLIRPLSVSSVNAANDAIGLIAYCSNAPLVCIASIWSTCERTWFLLVIDSCIFQVECRQGTRKT